MDLPKLIVLVSGKRKSGKDYISERLAQIVGAEKCEIVRISEPIKSYYAKQNNLDLAQLLSANEYKERYRLDMIKWSEDVRSKDPGYFCKIACENTVPKLVWIVSDIRRHTDVNWFTQKYADKIKTVRISADIETRRNRGWMETKGVDDAPSECDLDDYVGWNLELRNNNTEEFEQNIGYLKNLIEKCI